MLEEIVTEKRKREKKLLKVSGGLKIIIIKFRRGCTCTSPFFDQRIKFSK